MLTLLEQKKQNMGKENQSWFEKGGRNQQEKQRQKVTKLLFENLVLNNSQQPV